MIRYTMLETQISEGHHTSCHFCFDKFEGSLDKGLDLSKYELSITDPRSHFHIHYLNRDDDYIEQKVLDAYDINVDFPVIFFGRELPYRDGFRCAYHLSTLKKLKSPFVRDVVNIIKLFKGNFIDIILASDFSQDGVISDKDINIEIIPHMQNYKEIGEILEKNFELPKLQYYEESFNDYNEKDFAWHIKIKLFRYIKKPLVKFYKTYPNNPYLHFKIYDK
tara:strand:+ start:79 stop:741 length:663 start_codon:yes stop_codon:yes gene_type:complete